MSAGPWDELAIDVERIEDLGLDWLSPLLFRTVSGSYRSEAPAGSGPILELRVDIDGRRPQQPSKGVVEAIKGRGA